MQLELPDNRDYLTGFRVVLDRQITNSIGMKLALSLRARSMGEDESAEATATYFNKSRGDDVLKADCFNDEHPLHSVRITKPFYMGTCHVTRGQFRKFVEDAGIRPTPRRMARGYTRGPASGWSRSPSTPGRTRVSSRRTSTRWSM